MCVHVSACECVCACVCVTCAALSALMDVLSSFLKMKNVFVSRILACREMSASAADGGGVVGGGGCGLTVVMVRTV